MKKRIIVILLAIVIVGCNNNKKKGILQPTNKVFLTAKIDGVMYSFNDKVSLNKTSEFSQIINGYNSKDKTRITLGFNLENQFTKSFELSNNIILVYHGQIDFKGKKVYHIWQAKKSEMGSSGKITITKNSDTYLEGTFSFKGVGNSKLHTSVKNITEGKFRVLKK